MNLFQEFDVARGELVDLESARASRMISHDHELGAARNPFAVEEGEI